MSAFDGWKDADGDLKDVKDTKGLIRKGPAFADRPADRIAADDDAYVAGGKDDESKLSRRNFIEFLNTVNGSAASTIPGASRSYIPVKNFFQLINPGTLRRDDHQVLEMAHNWAALGKGDGGLYGAAVRWGLREHYVKTRETTVVQVRDGKELDHQSDDVKALVESYLKASKGKGDVIGFWVTNASQVAALAGALQLSTGHHWDANNRKPQDALLGALGQRDDVSDDAKRALFYLSVHPLPLSVIETFRTAASSDVIQGFSPAVRMRAGAVPAGFSVLQVTVAALDQMKSEKFYPQIARFHGATFDAAARLLGEVKARPTSYHVNAQDYGVPKRVADESKILTAKIIGVAYAQEIIKGTLGNAIAIAKFASANSRQVNRWKAAFKSTVGDGEITLDFMLGQ